MLSVLYLKSIKRSLAVLCAVSFALNVALPGVAYPQAEIIMPQKGMCYVTWEKETFASEYSDASIAKLADLGVDHISICVTQYQEKYDSTSIIFIILWLVLFCLASPKK